MSTLSLPILASDDQSPSLKQPQTAPGTFQLNMNLVRSLASNRRDSAVAIASAGSENCSPPPERDYTHEATTALDNSTENNVKTPSTNKKKKKKKSKASATLPETHPEEEESICSTTSADSASTLVGTYELPTQESLDWLESAVVKGDTKPTGKKVKNKKKAAKKLDQRKAAKTDSVASEDPANNSDGDEDFETRQVEKEMPEETCSDQDPEQILGSRTEVEMTPAEDDIFGNMQESNWADDMAELDEPISNSSITAPLNSLASLRATEPSGVAEEHQQGTKQSSSRDNALTTATRISNQDARLSTSFDRRNSYEGPTSRPLRPPQGKYRDSTHQYGPRPRDLGPPNTVPQESHHSHQGQHFGSHHNQQRPAFHKQHHPQQHHHFHPHSPHPSSRPHHVLAHPNTPRPHLQEHQHHTDSRYEPRHKSGTFPTRPSASPFKQNNAQRHGIRPNHSPHPQPHPSHTLQQTRPHGFKQNWNGPQRKERGTDPHHRSMDSSLPLSHEASASKDTLRVQEASVISKPEIAPWKDARLVLDLFSSRWSMAMNTVGESVVYSSS